MATYRVEDMTCGHCVSTITKAVRSVDSGAKVDVNLSQRLVRIEPTERSAVELLDVIAEAGYTPVHVSTESAPATRQPARTSGRCGCCK